MCGKTLKSGRNPLADAIRPRYTHELGKIFPNPRFGSLDASFRISMPSGLTLPSLRMVRLLRHVGWLVVFGWLAAPNATEASCSGYAVHAPSPVSGLFLPADQDQHGRLARSGEEKVPVSPCSGGQCRKGRPTNGIPVVPKVSPVEDFRAVCFAASRLGLNNGHTGRVVPVDDEHLVPCSPDRLERPPRS